VRSAGGPTQRATRAGDGNWKEISARLPVRGHALAARLCCDAITSCGVRRWMNLGRMYAWGVWGEWARSPHRRHGSGRAPPIEDTGAGALPPRAHVR
jgi:hypothetical protein